MKEKKKNHKWFWFLLGFLLIVGMSNANDGDSNSTQVASVEPTPTSTPVPTEDPNEALLNVLEQCGFNVKNVRVEVDGFSYDGKEGKYTKLNDGTVVKVKYADIVIYEDGIDEDTIIDINTLPLDIFDQSTLQYWAEEDVKKYLNYPETAEFGSFSDMLFDVDEEGNWLAGGYVTASNAFGVPSKYKYVCSYKMENYIDYQATFNGCELFE